MRSTFDRRLWILLFFISLQCIQITNQENIIEILKQQLNQQSTDVNASQSVKNYVENVVSNYSVGINKNTNRQMKTSIKKYKRTDSCANHLNGEEEQGHLHLQKSQKYLHLNDQKPKSKQNQHHQQQRLNSIPSHKNTAKFISHMPSPLSIPSINVINNYINSSLVTNKLQYKHNFLQSYLAQQGPTSENAAQESLEKQQRHRIRRRAKTNADKSLDFSLTSSDDVISSEEFDGNTNKLFSSNNIRNSDIRINKTKIVLSSSTSLLPSLSSLSPSLSKSSSSSSDSSLLASVPALSGSKLLYSQNDHSEDSLSSSFEDENIHRSGVDGGGSSSSSSSISSSSTSISSSRKNDDINKKNSNSILPSPSSSSSLQMNIVAKNTYSDSSRPKLKALRSLKTNEPVVIIDDAEEFDSGKGDNIAGIDVVGGGGGGRGRDVSVISTGSASDEDNEYYSNGKPMVMPLRPIIRPYDEGHDEEMSVVYAEQHTEVRLVCEVDMDIAASSWYKNGLSVHAIERSSRITDYRFVKEVNGALTITNAMLEDDGKWQCEAENANAYVENARPVKLVVLDRPKPPYLLIDSRRLDAGNIFVPVKENSELNLACVSEGGNPKPTLSWEVLLSPGVDRHTQKVATDVLELEEVKKDKDKLPYKMNTGAKSEARLPAVYRAHHNAKILCVMEHPTLKIRQNASLLLDVQYTPSFAISRTPGFGYPLREGIEVSLKCDVDSNPPSIPRWQKDDGDTPVPQTGDGFLNFTSIRREHSGWYKCTSRHLNFQYSSIGYYLSVRYDSVDVTSEPDDQDVSVAASHNNKGQLEVQLGGTVTLQCPQGSLGCWSHLDPITARLRGLGQGLSTPTGQFAIKDVVYQDAGTYKCIGQSPINKKRLEVLQTVGVLVKGVPTVVARNATPVAYPGSPLHLSVEFCANPPAYAARWLHGDRVFTPGNQYGSTVLAYGVTDLPTPFCKEARLTYVSMHERVPRTFYFIVSSPIGVAEAVFKVNFTMRYRTMSNNADDQDEELSEPEEIQFPVFGGGGGGSGAAPKYNSQLTHFLVQLMSALSLTLFKLKNCFLSKIFLDYTFQKRK